MISSTPSKRVCTVNYLISEELISNEPNGTHTEMSGTFERVPTGC